MCLVVPMMPMPLLPQRACLPRAVITAALRVHSLGNIRDYFSPLVVNSVLEAGKCVKNNTVGWGCSSVVVASRKQALGSKASTMDRQTDSLKGSFLWSTLTTYNAPVNSTSGSLSWGNPLQLGLRSTCKIGRPHCFQLSKEKYKHPNCPGSRG